MEQLIKSFEESVQDPKFRTAALMYGKVLGLPHNIGCRRRYHELLCENALRRGEKLSKAVLGDYPNLLKAARAKGLLGTPESAPQPVAKIETLAKSMRSSTFRESALGWGKFKGIPWGVGAERAYHRHLVEKALERGEAVPADVCADHPDLREVLRKSRSGGIRDTGAGDALKKSRGEIQLELEELLAKGELPDGVLAKFGTYGVFGLTDDIRQKIGL